MKVENNPKRPDIVYSCYYQKSREGENFVSEHVLSYQLSGSLVLNDGKTEYAAAPGSLRFIKRNQLLKFVKYPPTDGEFKSITLYLTQQVLKEFSLKYAVFADHKTNEQSVLLLETNLLMKNYFDALLAYHHADALNDPKMTALKVNEAILLLLQLRPDLQSVLFDFNNPFKIDLEAFMNQNFYFNVSLERFAYLTGRSLAAFKRDFGSVFGLTPGKWLLQKRLQEAHYLIKQKGKHASDIYLDLGFEDLSHFSFAFKKQFGQSPSKIS
ncbi:helix-turn-helix domain-containing protein [Pedobacter sp. AW1-32]|uniref:helix-turn-helix domain-containing protein n=1 Tax=Pedobacter sp. AW1-32 TaxID=3383026 RepID=UPI003FF0ECBA